MLYLLANLVTYIAAISVIALLAQRGHRNPVIWALIGGVGAFLIMFGGSVVAFELDPDAPSTLALPLSYAWLALTIVFVKYRPYKDVVE